MTLDIEVKGNPGQIDDTATWLGQAAGKVDSAASDTRAARGESEAGWQGDAGDAFRTSAPEAGSRISALHSNITQVQKGLSTFAGKLRSVENQMIHAATVARGGGLTVTATTIEDPGPAPSALGLPTSPTDGTGLSDPFTPAADPALAAAYQKKVAAYRKAERIVGHARSDETAAHHALTAALGISCVATVTPLFNGGRADTGGNAFTRAAREYEFDRQVVGDGHSPPYQNVPGAYGYALRHNLPYLDKAGHQSPGPVPAPAPPPGSAAADELAEQQKRFGDADSAIPRGTPTFPFGPVPVGGWPNYEKQGRDEYAYQDWVQRYDRDAATPKAYPTDDPPDPVPGDPYPVPDHATLPERYWPEQIERVNHYIEEHAYLPSTPGFEENYPHAPEDPNITTEPVPRAEYGQYPPSGPPGGTPPMPSPSEPRGPEGEGEGEAEAAEAVAP